MNFQFPLFDYFGRYIINTNLFFFFLADKFTYTEAQKIMMHQKKGGVKEKKKKRVMSWTLFLCMETLDSNLIQKIK